MMGMLQQAGATITSDADTADVLVVNTCSFIDKAQQESVDTILEMARLKTDGRAQRLVVAGCMVERYRDEIQKKYSRGGCRGWHRRAGRNSCRCGINCSHLPAILPSAF